MLGVEVSERTVSRYSRSPRSLNFVDDMKILPAFTPAPFTLVPRKTGSGDADFRGHGPAVTARVTYSIAPGGREVRANLFMTAFEARCPSRSPKSDHTKAVGSDSLVVHTVDPGFRIKELIIGRMTTERSYCDEDHEPDPFNEGSEGPVKSFEFIGDTGGDEAGTDTRMTVKFNPVRIKVVQTGDCVAEETLRRMVDTGHAGPVVRASLGAFMARTN